MISEAVTIAVVEDNVWSNSVVNNNLLFQRAHGKITLPGIISVSRNSQWFISINRIMSSELRAIDVAMPKERYLVGDSYSMTVTAFSS